MASKKVTWANHKGGYLEHRRDVSPVGRSRPIPTKQPSRSIPSRNMDRVVRERHVNMLKKIRAKLEKCQRELLQLQQYCEKLMKEEDIISRKIKHDVMNAGNTRIFLRLVQIDNNLVNKRGNITEKKLELRQLSNKMKATKKPIHRD